MNLLLYMYYAYFPCLCNINESNHICTLPLCVQVKVEMPDLSSAHVLLQNTPELSRDQSALSEVFVCAVCSRVMLTWEEAQQHMLTDHLPASADDALPAGGEESLGQAPEEVVATTHVVMDATDGEILALQASAGLYTITEDGALDC